MTKIRYKIKIQLPEIGIAVTALVLFVFALNSQNFTISLILLILSIIATLASDHRPRTLFVKRLNSFFAVVHYPFCKWHSIYQMPSRKEKRLTRRIQCSAIYSELSRQMAGMFSFIDTEQGLYRTITHEVLKKHLETYQKHGKLKIISCKPIYRKSLIKIQNSMFHNKCKECPDSVSCRYRGISEKARQFYYIEFYVPTH